MKWKGRSVLGNGIYKCHAEVTCPQCGTITVRVTAKILGVWSKKHVNELVSMSVIQAHHNNHMIRDVEVSIRPGMVGDN